MKKTVLDVKIDDISLKKATSIVSDWLSHRKNPPKIIVTPGPEFLLTAQEDAVFKRILNAADLAPSESFGLQLFCGFQNRIPGVDLMLALCGLAQEKNWSVGLFGGAVGVAKKTKEKLIEKFPGLKISYAIDGYDTDDNIINLYDTDILFVNLGHPKQEKFLAANRHSGPLRREASRVQNPVFRVGVGVGGSFDLISGVYPRAPKIFRVLGLEWFWRVLTKPGHLKRGLRATIVFPLMLIFYRWQNLFRILKRTAGS